MTIKEGRILKWTRRVVALVTLAASVMLLTLTSMSAVVTLRFVAEMQFVPAVLVGAAVTVGIIVVVTLLLGRIYCSTVCPLGTLQDVFARLPRLSRSQQTRRCYRYKQGRTAVRVSVLVLAVAAMLAGSSAIMMLIEPYGVFGRMMVYVSALVGGNGLLEAIGSAVLPLVLALVTLVVIAWWSARSGRGWCNHVCPVGTVLGGVARNSVWHIDIDTDRCINCHRCEYQCKSHCINLNDHVIEMSRCVVCFDCLDVCPNEAISYTYRHHRLSTPLMMKVGGRRRVKTEPEAALTMNEMKSPSEVKTEEGTGSKGVNRRTFLIAGAIAVSLPVVKAVEKRVPAPLREKSGVPEHRPVPPPGTRSIDRLLRSCVGCGACVRICPEKVIEPSMSEWGLTHPLVPVMNYRERGCRYDCNDCTQVCPTGALTPLTVEEKQNIAIGLACVDAEECVGCGRCARACPAEAITMAKPAGRERRLAMVDHSKCIGCGQCQAACPVTPVAIVVNGLRL